MKKRRVLVRLAILALFLFGFAGCGKKVTKIEINQYVNLTFDGYDGYGTVSECSFDAKKMKNDNEKVLEEVSKKTLTNTFQNALQLNPTQNLKNGDTVSVTWNVDEDDLKELEAEYHIDCEFEDFEVKVSDLKALASVDLFSYITVDFIGTAPNGRANYERSLDIPCTGLSYNFDKKSELKNGDTVTLTITPNDSSYTLDRYLAERYQMVPTASSKTYTVSGLSTGLYSISLLSDDILSQMKKATEDAIVSSTSNWEDPSSLRQVTYLGPVLFNRSGSTWFYLVYKVDVSSALNGTFAYYYCGYYYNLVLNADGTLSAELPNVRTLTASFRKNNLRYTGYESYDVLLENITQKEADVENNVDVSLITAQTYVPKDYSKVTATPEFTTDCFTFRKVDGGVMVGGFTQKGYDLIHTFTAEDCISVTLPELSNTNEPVVGFATAGGGTDTYTFGTAFDKEAPNVVLVCPDSYTSFYGFYNSSGNYKLRGVELGKGITAFHTNAFRDCSGLTEITLPEGVTAVPAYMFQRCYQLTKVVLPASLTSIENYAFYDCSSLTDVNLDKEHTEVGANAFYNCPLIPSDTQ